LWDRRNRRVAAALTVSDTGRDGAPTESVDYLPDAVLWCVYTPGQGWAAERISNPVGRALAVAVTNDPQTRRPLGRSRLTYAVMGLTDMAVRAYVRMEGNAEFYSAPQRALLGVSEEAFQDGLAESDKFRLAQDRLLALTRDENGDKPQLQQLQQAKMTPQSDKLRTVAMGLSGESENQPWSLGIIDGQ